MVSIQPRRRQRGSVCLCQGGEDTLETLLLVVIIASWLFDLALQ